MEHHAVELVIIVQVDLFLLPVHPVFGLQQLPFGAVFVSAFTVTVAGGLTGDHGNRSFPGKKKQPSISKSWRSSAPAPERTAVSFCGENLGPPWDRAKGFVPPRRAPPYTVLVTRTV